MTRGFRTLDKISLAISFLLSFSIFYTIRIENLIENNQLKNASVSIFALDNLSVIGTLFLAVYLVLKVIVY